MPNDKTTMWKLGGQGQGRCGVLESQSICVRIVEHHFRSNTAIQPSKVETERSGSRTWINRWRLTSRGNVKKRTLGRQVGTEPNRNQTL